MRDFEVSTGDPCVNTARRRDGAYTANVHYLKGAGIKTEYVRFGTQDPSQAETADLVDVLRTMVGRQDTVYKGEKLPMEHMIGFSIVRHCVRDVHAHDMPMPKIVDSPRRERVGSFAIARSLEDIAEIQPHQQAQLRRASDRGITGAILMSSDGERLGNVQLQYLAVTPQEHKEHALLAVGTLPVAGRTSDPYVPLHPLHDQDGFVEQIIMLDEL